MHAFYEEVTGLIRFGTQARAHGDPYEGTVCVKHLGDGVCELVGYVRGGSHTAEAHRAILAVLFQRGWHTAIVRRLAGTRPERVFRYDLRTGRLKRRRQGCS